MPAINDKQWQHLKKARSRGTLSQAYLFCGPEGTGKFDLAVEFVVLVNGKSDRDRIFQGHDPDVFVVKPAIEEKAGKRRKKYISIRQIKEVTDKIGYYAYRSKFKFLVIKNAQKMTATAANSLLKLVEEPPIDLIILLVSDNEQRVLSTIRSRCQTIRFGIETEEKVFRHLKNKFSGKESSFLKMCASFSQGRVKFAENLASDKTLFEETQESWKIFRGALKGGLLKGFDLSEQFSAEREKLIQSMAQWAWYLRNFLIDHIKKNGDREVEKKVFSMLRSLVNLRSELQHSNVNQRVQLDNFFVQIH